MYQPGYGTEYSENYSWDDGKATAGSWTKESSGLFGTNAAKDENTKQSQYDPDVGPGYSTNMEYSHASEVPRDPTKFQSDMYPSVYRETVVRKDDRGKYIDPFKNITSKPYGRRLMYDQTHPDKMYGSQWSSELADTPGPYSFPTTTEFDPEIPWTKDMQWQDEGEIGSWPTDLWKTWTPLAECPPYDGHDDQLEYSQYKVQVS